MSYPRALWSVVAGMGAIATACFPTPTLAQSITAEAGTAATQVTIEGNEFEITGGALSSDRSNLFHSFEQFGLRADQIATFITDPTVQNVISRVVGGNASYIDGLLRVTGSDANLFLLNPAGILLGANARLDLSGSFAATTASGLGFADGWLAAVGDADYAALAGTPTSYGFSALEPGAIVNQAPLAVPTGQQLTLVGGTVINTGTLSAPGGEITVAAVPGAQLVRISQAQQLLNLELATLPQAAPSLAPGGQPLSLPALLTGSPLAIADSIAIAADGQVQLATTNQRLSAPPGSSLVTGRLDVANSEGTGGAIAVVGQTVGLAAATVDASGEIGGGTVRIGGDYHGQGSLPTAQRTLVDGDSTVRADAITQGIGGRVIVWAEDTTAFGGQISAQGGALSGDGGFVEVSGHQQLQFQGQVDVGATAGTPGTLLLDPENILIAATSGSAASLPDIFQNEFVGTTATVDAAALEGQTGTVILQARNDIVIEDGLSLNFVPSDFPITFTADADNNGAGSFRMDPTATLATQGRPLTISGASIVAGQVNSFGANSALAGSGNFGSADDVRLPESSGDVALRAIGDIQVARVFGQNVAITSDTGNIRTGSISAEAGTVTSPSTDFSGTGSTMTLRAPQGTVAFSGLLRAGQINKSTDSRIEITANRILGTDPVAEIEAQPSGDRVLDSNGNPVVSPMSLYAYPANVDAGANNSASPKVSSGQIGVQFGSDPPIVTGSGNPLITLNLLSDRSLVVGDLNFDGSSILGIVGVGAERAPSVIVVLRDNQFSGLNIEEPTDPTTTLEAVERDPETAQNLRCQPETAAPILVVENRSAGGQPPTSPETSPEARAIDCEGAELD